jgi:lipopolysaccharide export system permease protein
VGAYIIARSYAAHVVALDGLSLELDEAGMKPKIISRYIAWQVVKSILLVLFIIVGLYTFTSFISQLNNVGQGSFGLWQAFSYVLLTLPLNMYSLFPMIALIGSLIGLGMLASHNEINVMRAAGVSVGRVVLTVLGASIILIVIALIIGEGIGPGLSHYADQQKAIAQSGGQATQTKSGMWLRDGDDFVYIRTVLPDSNLQGVSIFHFNDNLELQTASYAKSAVYQQGQWYLRHIMTTNYTNPKKNTVSTTKQRIWHAQVDPKTFGFFSLSAQTMSLARLGEFIHYQGENGLSSTRYSFVFWQRVFQPLATLIMILLALPFVFGSMRTMTMGLRVVIGVLCGCAFFLLNRFLGSFSLVFQVPPFFAALLPIALFSILALWLTRRAS